MDHLILSHIVKTRIFDSTFSDYVSLTKFQLTPDFFSLSGNLLFDKEIVYENGRSESGILLRRQKEGYWVDIYDNGSVREGGIYLHGFKEGWWITYDSDENKFEEGPYIHGKQNGEWTRYLSTDQSVKEIGTYVNNFMEGDWYLVVNGTKHLMGRHEGSSRIGIWTEYDNNGNPRYEIDYRKGGIRNPPRKWVGIGPEPPEDQEDIYEEDW